MSVARPRSEWGPRHGRGRKGADLRNEQVCHITVNRELPPDVSAATEAAAMRAIERYVVEQRGFSGFPYSFCGFQSGRIWEGRGWGYDGAHTQRGRNSTAYALARYGDPNVMPSDAFFAAGRALNAEGIAKGFLTRLFRISGHRDHWPKACPGDPYYNARERIRPGVSTPIPEADEEDDVLEKGDIGGEVTWMKWRINQLLHEGQSDPRGAGESYGLPVTPVFDDETERYVRHCQSELGFRKHPGKATAAFLIRLDYLALRNVERARAKAA